VSHIRSKQRQHVHNSRTTQKLAHMWGKHLVRSSKKRENKNNTGSLCEKPNLPASPPSPWSTEKLPMGRRSTIAISFLGTQQWAANQSPSSRPERPWTPPWETDSTSCEAPVQTSQRRRRSVRRHDVGRSRIIIQTGKQTETQTKLPTTNTPTSLPHSDRQRRRRRGRRVADFYGTGPNHNFFLVHAYIYIYKRYLTLGCRKVILHPTHFFVVTFIKLCSIYK
jgi:hypothetical protein